MGIDPEVLKIKVTRKRILTFLNMMYPTPLQLITIFESVGYLDRNYDMSLFKKDINYMFAKDWLEFVDEKIGGGLPFEKRVILLTAEGKEIAERTQTDPALEI
jgi:hypothetical protein